MSWYERKKLIYKQARPSQIEFHERQMELAMRGIFGEMADSFEMNYSLQCVPQDSGEIIPRISLNFMNVPHQFS